MRKPNSDLGEPPKKFLIFDFGFSIDHPIQNQKSKIQNLLVVAASLALTGCATPQYAIRPTPVPEESSEALEIERTISAVQAEEWTEQGARPVGLDERLGGFAVQRVVDRLSRVTERSALRYRVYLYQDLDPNAAALADGRMYLSSGLLAYLAGRGSREDELAFILGHELAHTVAQHLVKRYRTLQQQELIFAVAAAGASAITRGASEAAGRLALQAVSLAREAVHSNFSQEQELEADQLGIQYVIRAGYSPASALDLLEDFARFDSPWPFLRTHPYILERRERLARYLADTGRLPAPPAGGAQAGLSPSAGARPAGSVGTTSGVAGDGRAGQVNRLRDIQRLYPRGSVSWTNLQRQIDALETRHADPR
jgi:predicted Zn-dependent protease